MMLFYYCCVAKPHSIPYGDGLFLNMFGGWKAKQYDCPTSSNAPRCGGS